MTFHLEVEVEWGAFFSRHIHARPRSRIGRASGSGLTLNERISDRPFTPGLNRARQFLYSTIFKPQIDRAQVIATHTVIAMKRAN
jgi:hypothetical protein